MRILKVYSVYRLLVYVMLPIAFCLQFIKGFRNRGYWARWGERLGVVSIEGPVDCWIHAVSVGEVRAVVPLVRSILGERPECRICVTTTTPTGSATVHQLLGDLVEHCYLPYDTGVGVRQFLARVRPKTGLIIETEIWPNLIHIVHHRTSFSLASSHALTFAHLFFPALLLHAPLIRPSSFLFWTCVPRVLDRDSFSYLSYPCSLFVLKL